VQVSASDFMKSRGLPYHINLMPLNGRFAISRAEFRHMRANGHELSLHYNFMYQSAVSSQQSAVGSLLSTVCSLLSSLPLKLSAPSRSAP